MRLYLVRHPRPDVSPGLCYGSTEVACSQEAVERAALKLRGELPAHLPLFSSPSMRCQRLAICLCEVGPRPGFQTDERLREMDFGAWEGRPWAEIPETELSSWTQDFAAYRCGGLGESASQLVRRVAQALTEQIARGQDAVWVTHAGVIRAVHWLTAQPAGALSSWARTELLPPQLCLRAADWPQIEVPWAQVLIWDWPHAEQQSGLAQGLA
jgi:alpha-ribazole phosphatase